MFKGCEDDSLTDQITLQAYSLVKLNTTLISSDLKSIYHVGPMYNLKSLSHASTHILKHACRPKLCKPIFKLRFACFYVKTYRPTFMSVHVNIIK